MFSSNNSYILINSICRVCMDQEELISMDQTLDGYTFSIKDMLEMVTSTLITVDSKEFPNKICQKCLNQLTLLYSFQLQYKETERWLEENFGEVLIEHKACGARNIPPVDLIYGTQSYDLRDVLVVESEEIVEKSKFDGFLRNLGSEISAVFVTKDDNGLIKNIDTDISSDSNSLHQLQENDESTTKFDSNIPISQLEVRKVPQDSKIIIESRINNVKTIIKTLYECQICAKLFSKKENFLDHTKACPNFYICDECGHVCHSTSALYHHKQNHKGPRFLCHLCNKSFVTTSRLKSHLEIHRNKRNFLCNYCGKSFNYSVSLKYHLRVHTDEKKFVCNFCGIRFRASNALQRHIRTHTLERPYRCQYCPKSFRSSGELKPHEMLHTGEKPYVCEYCNKKYARKWNLTCHYLTHKGAHSCNLCAKTFVELKFLKLHLETSHRSANKLE